MVLNGIEFCRKAGMINIIRDLFFCLSFLNLSPENAENPESMESRFSLNQH